MWGDHVLQMSPEEPMKPKIVSKLNPYAKEFYPNYLKSWRIKLEPEDEKQIQILKTCEELPVPRQGKAIVIMTIKALMDVRYTTSSREEIYGRQIVSEQLKPLKGSKKEMPKQQTKKSHVTALVNGTGGTLKKPLAQILSKRHNEASVITKYNCTTMSGNEKTNENSKRSGSISQQKPSVNAQLSQENTKSNAKNKLLNLGTTSKIISTKLSATSKDSISIKSNNSSDRSSISSRYTTSSSSLKLLPSKQLEKSSKTTPLASLRKKEAVAKCPPSAVASSLRKTETQKVS